MGEENIFYIIGGTVGISACALGLSSGIVATCKVLGDCIENARLARDEAKGLGTIFPTPTFGEVTDKKIDKRGIKKDASIVINEFVSTLKEAGIDLDNLYRNFRKASIRQTSSSYGSFDQTDNYLLVNNDNLRETLLRALLEMTVTFKDTKTCIRGFERINYSSQSEKEEVVENFGMGLNEAYKEIILGRYFELPYRYDFLVTIVKLIEDMVGRERMEDLFFKGDLGSLVYRTHIYHSTMEMWIKRLDRVFLSCEREIKSIYPKLDVLKRLGNASYRSLFVGVSKKYIDYIVGLYKLREGKTSATLKLSSLNSLLYLESTKSNADPFKLKESDIDTIKSYGDPRLEQLRGYPYIMRIVKPRQF